MWQRNTKFSQTNRRLRRRLTAPTFPGVHSDVVVVATSRNKQGAGQLCHDVKAKKTVIERLGGGNIPKKQVNMTQFGSRGHGWISQLRIVFDLAEKGIEINRVTLHSELGPI